MKQKKFRKGIIAVCMLAVTLMMHNAYSSIDLVTVPNRESVQLTIYNSADITMVKETRILTFKKGLNKIQFSWAGTLIDPTSLRISFKNKKNSIDLLDTTFPATNSKALQWNIKSEISGAARVQITYFTSGITWKANYVALTNKRENRMNFKGFVDIINKSGEDYPNAKVRLVVGTINLVEKISKLANKTQSYKSMPYKMKRRVRRKFSRYMELAEDKASGSVSGIKKEITKEGISEYFLFSIAGTETIPNGWKKRLTSLEVDNVPVKVIYYLSDRTTRGHVYKRYEFKNQKIDGKKGKGQLGQSPLPDGMVNIFSQNAKKDLSFKGAIRIKYIANGDKVKIHTGKSMDIRIRRILKNYRRTDIVVTQRAYSSYYYVKSYNEHFHYETTLQNTLDWPVLLEIERRFNNKYKAMDMPFKYEKVNYRTIKFYPKAKAHSKKILNYHIKVSHGK